MDKKTATRPMHVYLYQRQVLTTANVESSLLSNPFRFDVIQFVLSQGVAQQPIRKQCHKLLGLLVYVAGRTSNDLHSTGTITQAAVATAVSHVVLAQALDLTDPDYSEWLIEGLTGHLTNWQTEDAENEYQNRLSEVLELVTQALCCVNKDDNFE